MSVNANSAYAARQSIKLLRRFSPDVLNANKEALKEKTISEDEGSRVEKQIADLMDSNKNKIDAMASEREKDIMTL